MPAVRIIPVLLKQGAVLVKGQCFNKERTIGPAVPSVRVYQARDVDELIVLDVTGVDQSLSDSNIGRFKWIEDINSFLTMPLSVGGGIRNLLQIRYLINNGADKVVLNTVIHEAPELVKNAVSEFGSQSVIASIDCLHDGETFIGYNSWKERGIPKKCSDLIETAIRCGAGEIMLTSVSHEGKMRGFDNRLLELVPKNLSVPLLLNGGGGTENTFVEILQYSAQVKKPIDGLCASSCFHFSPSTPRSVSNSLIENGFNARIG
jgi:cyclase